MNNAAIKQAMASAKKLDRSLVVTAQKIAADRGVTFTQAKKAMSLMAPAIATNFGCSAEFIRTWALV